jgi:hypothetical protein
MFFKTRYPRTQGSVFGGSLVLAKQHFTIDVNGKSYRVFAELDKPLL